MAPSPLQARPRRRALLTVAALLAASGTALVTGPTADATSTAPHATTWRAIGTGGAVTSVDPDATAAGLQVLRAGGNAADAAVATAAALGVTEPFSSGLGGGGFLVYYDASTHKVSTVDGREEAPARFTRDSFIENGQPIDFTEAVTSGLSVGVPGTTRLLERALDDYGTMPMSRVLRPAIRLADEGFVVDRTFNVQVRSNAERFRDFTSTSALYLPGGKAPAIGSVFRNPDLADTYRLLARGGADAFYEGPLARDVARTAQHPPVRRGADRNVRPGLMTTYDLARYAAPVQAPTHVRYRAYDVYGMAPPSSGGSTVGEALNILENFDLQHATRAQALHYYLEASRLAFADRNRYVGDAAYVDVPLRQLLSDGFAKERACLIDPHQAAASPVDPGRPDGSYGGCPTAPARQGARAHEGQHTTHLTVADRDGNIASLTFTIEQIGGSGIVVPGRGFLLNNELTDFNFAPSTPGVPDPNLPAPGKRPRSSMSPTIVLQGGRPIVALGSPGGSTIITTVLQTLVNHLDLKLTLPQAVAAPRASQRNGDPGIAEPAFLSSAYGQALVNDYGQQLTLQTPPPDFPPQLFAQEIGAVEAIRFRYRAGRTMIAVAEPTRRGGGDARVVTPRR